MTSMLKINISLYIHNTYVTKIVICIGKFWSWIRKQILIHNQIVLGGGVIVKGYPIEKESIKVQSTRKIVRNVIFLLLRLTAIKAKMRKNGPYPVPLKMLSNTHFLTDFQKLNCRRKMRTRAKSFVLWKKWVTKWLRCLKSPQKLLRAFWQRSRRPIKKRVK